MPDIVTIDGPAASGKSTIAMELARVLGYRYINSGNYYRAITLAIIRERVNLNDSAELKELLERVQLTQENGRILLDGEDVTDAIRSLEVTDHVSSIAKIPLVRESVNEELRRVATRHDSIVEGRDIGTVVFPNACLKVFLEASIEERARRRQRDFADQGVDSKYERLLADLKRRDGIDSSRENAPLKRPDNALVIDSTALSIGSVVENIRSALNQRFLESKSSITDKPNVIGE